MNKQELKEFINSDLYRLEGKYDIKSKIKNILLNGGFKFIYTHRKGNYYRVKLYRYNIKYGFEISNLANIDKGFYIGHRGSIVINPNAIIGKNFSITSGVTIGQENRGKRKGTPKIGDSVWIGSNSTIVGNITIGNNVLIAPGSFINFDVPNNSIVIGNPAIIKSNPEATRGYITWEVKEK